MTNEPKLNETPDASGSYPPTQTFYGLIDDNSGLRLVRSRDGGIHWDPVSDLSAKGSLTELYAHVTAGPVREDGSQDLFLTTSKGLFRSTDAGQNFAPFPPDSPVGPGATDVKISRDGQHLVVGVAGAGVRMFNLSGGSWTESSPANLADFIQYHYDHDTYGVDSHGRPIACSANNECPYTTTHDNHGKPELDVSAIQIDPDNPGVVYVGTGRLLYRLNGTQWELINKGMTVPGHDLSNDSRISSIDVDRKTRQLVVATCQGVYRTTGPVTRGGTAVSASQVNFGTKFRSAHFINDYTSGTVTGMLRAYETKMNPLDSNQIVTASATGVYLSRDGGGTWLRVASTVMPERIDLVGSHSGVEYRSVAWLPDGEVEVSGDAGTYRFQP